jgi:hypothetical protein
MKKRTIEVDKFKRKYTFEDHQHQKLGKRKQLHTSALNTKRVGLERVKLAQAKLTQVNDLKV